VSGYGLDDPAIEVLSPAEEKIFFLQPLCPDRLWGLPSLLYNGYQGGPFSGAKARPGRDADHLEPRSRMSTSYTSSPPRPFVARSGTALALLLLLPYAQKPSDYVPNLLFPRSERPHFIALYSFRVRVSTITI
jgi:hypothetical protein